MLLKVMNSYFKLVRLTERLKGSFSSATLKTQKNIFKNLIKHFKTVKVWTVTWDTTITSITCKLKIFQICRLKVCKELLVLLKKEELAWFLRFLLTTREFKDILNLEFQKKEIYCEFGKMQLNFKEMTIVHKDFIDIQPTSFIALKR